ncbi:MAG: hypothetical protein LBJ35_06015 [Spirochaetaceae bacterium]|jgi:hypothetical protein|nr:hypothetical protein [Spirochaetaceae bacterium]
MKKPDLLKLLALVPAFVTAAVSCEHIGIGKEDNYIAIRNLFQVDGTWSGAEKSVLQPEPGITENKVRQMLMTVSAGTGTVTVSDEITLTFYGDNIAAKWSGLADGIKAAYPGAILDNSAYSAISRRTSSLGLDGLKSGEVNQSGTKIRMFVPDEIILYKADGGNSGGNSGGGNSGGNNNGGADAWSAVTSLSQLDGTWNFPGDLSTEDWGYGYDKIIATYDSDASITISAGMGTAVLSLDFTLTFSGNNIASHWDDIKSKISNYPKEDPAISAPIFDDKAYSAAYSSKITRNITLDEVKKRRAQINQNGTKVKWFFDDAYDYDDVEIMYKQ